MIISRQRSTMYYRYNFHVAVSLRQIREFRSTFGNISRECRTIVARQSYDSRETFVRVLQIPTNVALASFSFVLQSRDIHERVS